MEVLAKATAATTKARNAIGFTQAADRLHQRNGTAHSLSELPPAVQDQTLAYIQQHQLQPLVGQLMSSLAENQPADPVEHLISLLESVEATHTAPLAQHGVSADRR